MVFPKRNSLALTISQATPPRLVVGSQAITFVGRLISAHGHPARVPSRAEAEPAARAAGRGPVAWVGLRTLAPARGPVAWVGLRTLAPARAPAVMVILAEAPRPHRVAAEPAVSEERRLSEAQTAPLEPWARAVIKESVASTALAARPPVLVARQQRLLEARLVAIARATAATALSARDKGVMAPAETAESHWCLDSRRSRSSDAGRSLSFRLLMLLRLVIAQRRGPGAGRVRTERCRTPQGPCHRPARQFRAP